MRSIAVIVMLLVLVAGAAQAAPEGNGVEAALSLGTGSSHWLEGEATLGWRFLPSLVVSGRASATIIDDRDAATDLGVAVRAVNSGAVDRYIEKPWNPETLRAAIEIALHAGSHRVAG